MRHSRRTKFAASTAFFAVMTLLATGCGLSVAGLLVVDGAPSGGQGGDDATVSTPDDSGTGMGPDNPHDPVSDAGPPRTSPGDGARDPDDAGHGDAPEGAVEAGLSSHGTMACPAASDASTCDVGTSVCCTCPNCSVPFPTICLPGFPGCVPGGVYASLTCGSAANCPSGAECCATFDTNSALTGSSCKPSCAVADMKLCANSGECAGGRSCRMLTTIPGFSGCE